MIHVLIVEDSPVVRELLIHILGSDPAINIMGTQSNGADALQFLSHSKPDVITMDIDMPVMDGLEATRRIMETHPIPIVIVSGMFTSKLASTTFRAMEAGAVAAVKKPHGPGHPEYDVDSAKLIQIVKAMARIRVVRRWPKKSNAASSGIIPKIELPSAPRTVKIVAVGASTGGPPVLHAILSRLPETFPVPILIVQHIATGFVQGLADWLEQDTGHAVHVAHHGQPPLPAHIYIAPDSSHMGIDRDGRIVLSQDAPENGLRPSVSYLFRSAANVLGAGVVGVLLTGMGKDGAVELKNLRDCGAVTIAQDKQSSIVYGMPGEAFRLAAAMHVLPPDKIAELLICLTSK
jgi:two-component system chemotaxis response regulator CheB